MKTLQVDRLSSVETRVYKMPYALYQTHQSLSHKDTITIVFTNKKLTRVEKNYVGNPAFRVEWIVNKMIIETIEELESQYMENK